MSTTTQAIEALNELQKEVDEHADTNHLHDVDDQGLCKCVHCQTFTRLIQKAQLALRSTEQASTPDRGQVGGEGDSIEMMANELMRGINEVEAGNQAQAAALLRVLRMRMMKAAGQASRQGETTVAAAPSVTADQIMEVHRKWLDEVDCYDDWNKDAFISLRSRLNTLINGKLPDPPTS